MQPPNHTPLIALPAVVLDLETTGLDVRSDRVIQLGVINVPKAGKDPQTLIDQLINPNISIPPASTEIHHIKNSDVVEEPVFSDVANNLCKVIKNKVIIGQHIAFDLAIIKREFARFNLVWHEPVSLDVSLLAGALQPALFDVSMESICTFLGVNITDRHTALGDCLAAMHCWQKIIPLLQEKNIRTLGEAIAFSNQRQDLLLRQMESGWLEVPAGLVTSTTASAQRIDSYVFKHRLADVMSRPAVFVEPGTALRKAAKVMVERHLGCVLVGKPGSVAQGILTENDIMRVTADGKLDMDSAFVEKAMSVPVEVIHQDEMLYRALARMDRLNVSHLCVVDDNSIPSGMVSQRNLLQYRARGSNMLYDAMETANDVHALATAYSHVTGIANQLVSEELNGVEISNVISLELQTLVQRATKLAIDRMDQEGKGAVSCDWCVLVLGSAGRGESLLSADQDNALIHTGSQSDDAWFAQFGSYLAEILDSAGLPYCNGAVMVSNAQWRGNVEDWNARIAHWIQRARPEDLLNVDIFFDLVPVFGNSELAEQLHKKAVTLASKSHAFINLLADSVKSVTPQFGVFGRLPLVEGRLDLKRNGLLPLVSFARTLALRINSTERRTPQRIHQAVACGRLAEGDAERLIALQKTLLTLILKQQLIDSDAGIPVSTRVDVRRFSKRESNRLKHELHHLDTMVNEVKTFITAN
jgi:DNA polymerase-3 subunit epsilon/CBS domain-containing protein